MFVKPGRFPWKRRRLAALCAGGALIASGVAAQQYGGWNPPVNAEQPGTDSRLNTAFNDGCPILSPDGLSLYMATNRPLDENGTVAKDLDIWVATRATTTSPWGAPVRLPAPVNSGADEFCPTPVRGHGLFFVSKRTEANGDIYFTRLRHGVWDEPVHLGPNINSPYQEWSPSYFEDDRGRPVLYFSSTRPGIGPAGTQDIYYSVNFGPARPATELNTTANDSRPNVRHDGREIVFDSDRPGSLPAPSTGLPSPDIYIASRPSASAPWSGVTHLVGLSSTGADSRASLSWDGSIMVFGSNRAGGDGSGDIYVTTRPRIRGNGHDGHGGHDGHDGHGGHGGRDGHDGHDGHHGGHSDGH